MTVAVRKTQTLAKQDLDLDVTYQGDVVTELFDPIHSYKVIQRTEDAYLQPCSMCDREQQARYRVTIINLTTRQTFFVGRVCLEKFGVTYDELDKSTVLLALLARTWQAFKHHGGGDADFASTREAVEDMLDWLSYIADRGVKPYKEAAGAVARILGDLAHINDYKADVFALQAFVGVAYESQYKRDALRDRTIAAIHHPLLSTRERYSAERVLGFSDFTWDEVRALSEKLRTINGKPVPLRIRKVPAWDHASRTEYHEALRTYAEGRLQDLSENDTTRRPDEFLYEMRKLVQNVRNKGGYYELVFESSSFASVQRMQLPASLRQSIETMSAVLLMSAEPASYLRYTRTTDTHHSVGAMQRAAQQDDERDDDRPDRAPQERFYRAVILYVPDHYSPSYEMWARHGGFKKGRKHLEDLTSELLASSGGDE